MDKQALILLPGELFTKVELKSRLKVMNVNVNPNVQDKGYFVNAYNEAIKNEGSKLKIIDYLINDTKEMALKNKGINAYTKWIPQVDNDNNNNNNNSHRIQSQLYKEQRENIPQVKRFTLPPGQKNKIEGQEYNNDNTANSNFYMSNSNSNRINEIIPINVIKAVPNKDVLKSDQSIGIINDNINQIRKQSISLRQMPIQKVNQKPNLGIGHKELEINTKDSIVSNNQSKVNNTLPLKCQTISSVTINKDDNDPKRNIIEKEIPIRKSNTTITYPNTNTNTNSNIPSNQLLNSLQNDNLLPLRSSSIITEGNSNTNPNTVIPFSNNDLSMISTERNYLQQDLTPKQTNSFQYEDILSPLLVLTSVIAIIYYTFKFARDLTQPILDMKDLSFNDILRFLYQQKWLILFGFIVYCYFRRSNSKIAKEIFKDLKNTLNLEYLTHPDGLGLSQSSIISKYSAKYGLTIDDFQRLILPILDSLRAKDSNIKISEEKEPNGRGVLYWKWYE